MILCDCTMAAEFLINDKPKCYGCVVTELQLSSTLREPATIQRIVSDNALFRSLMEVIDG